MGIYSRLKDATNFVFNGQKGFINEEYIMTDGVSIFPYNSKENELLENIYNTFADNISLLKMKHVKWDKEYKFYTFDENSNYNYVLRLSTNELQTPTEFLNTIAYQCIKHGNAIILPIYKTTSTREITTINGRDYEVISTPKTELKGLEVVDVESYSFGFGYEEIEGEKYLIIKENCDNKTTRLIKYSDVIHIRYNPSNIFLGDKFTAKNNKIPNLLDAKLNSMLTDMATSGKITGILKLKTGMGGEEEKTNKLKSFTRAFVKGNNSGIAVLDSNEEFQMLTRDYKTVANEDIKMLKDNVYAMYRINEKIINGTYNYEEYEAFYNSMIEPFVKKIEEEFNRKLFTKTALTQGNRIIFVKLMLVGGSLKDQTQFLREMTQLNVLKINEARKLLQLNPIEEGDKLYGEMGQGTQVIEPQDNSGGENE
jgi:HK97 family phage portal protein